MEEGKNKKHHTCPVWAGYLLICPMRSLFHNPYKILSPFVGEGMKILEVGPGMGFFTLPLAEMVGTEGRVYAVDIQKDMLDRLMKRAEKRNLSERIVTVLADNERLNIEDLREIDFCLLFAVVHEVDKPEELFREIFDSLKPQSLVLIAEPKGHVSLSDFNRFLDIAKDTGFRMVKPLNIFRSHAMLLEKPLN